MPEQIVETTTIERDGATIIIAHPPVKKETNYWEIIQGWFNQETPKDSVSQVMEAPITPVLEQETIEIVVEVPIEIEKSVQNVIEPVQTQVSQSWTQWANLFSRENLASYKKDIKEKIDSLEGIDDRLSKDISKFKKNHIMKLGDVRIRSILMGCSAALLYKIISSNTKGFLRKSRNLAGSFIFMGYWLVPQLFNPFLRKPSLGSKIV